MPQLFVMTQETVDCLPEPWQVAFKSLRDPNLIAETFSVNDLIDAHQAQQRFCFEFDDLTQINMGISPAVSVISAELGSLSNRVSEKLATANLHNSMNTDTVVPQYELYVVDETLWVAVEQRLHQAGDPDRQRLKVNVSFFDALMANIQQYLAFHEACSTNLFAYYLSALPSRAA